MTSNAAQNLKVVELHNVDKPAESAADAIRASRSASFVQPPRGKLREISNSLAEELQTDIREFANQLAEKYNIDAATTSRRFASDSALGLDITIKMSASHGLGFNRFADALLRENGKKYGLRAKHYGVSFKVKGAEHIIKGFDENKQGKEPFVVLETPTGQVLAPVGETVKVLKQAGIL